MAPVERGSTRSRPRSRQRRSPPAARNAVATAAGTVRDLRIAEVVRQDVTIENGAVTGYRVRLSLSFKYDANE